MPGLGRITGLEPAGPIYRNLPLSHQLNRDDALFVDCIHTSARSGVIEPICHANFYPNSLRVQPQCCPQDDTCQHVSPVHYFIESIADNDSCKFFSVKCDDFKTTPCTLCSEANAENCTRMGYYAYHFPNARGSFILETKPENPFCIN